MLPRVLSASLPVHNAIEDYKNRMTEEVCQRVQALAFYKCAYGFHKSLRLVEELAYYMYFVFILQSVSP